jgi:Protein of unknown function, DUF547
MSPHRDITKSLAMSCSRRTFLSGLPVSLLPLSSSAATASQAFDHEHQAWSMLLGKHVVLLGGGQASQVNYAGMLKDKPLLQSYLDSLSRVNLPMFKQFSIAQQMAFLINAYNAFTVALVLTRYPKLASIKDLGGLLSNPWKKRFIPLLGETVSLDHIEHEWLRQPRRFDDPRIHFAVNCASIGCPMLREQAYRDAALDIQLDQQVVRFLSDKSRNRYNASTQTLQVSKILDWYRKDFESGFKGITSLPAFLAKYADQLTNKMPDREKIRLQIAKIDFLEYDWALNDVRK